MYCLQELFYEGSGSNAELILNLLLAFTLVYIPITIAIVGKRLWIKYRFTNKRVTVVNTSPLFANTVSQVPAGHSLQQLLQAYTATLLVLHKPHPAIK